MLIHRCELAGTSCDVRIAGGAIAEIAPALAPEPGEAVRDAAGGALLPGLNDHHLHLFAAAAALRSVRCGPPYVRTPEQLAAALSADRSDGWLRGVGYHESVAGELDRAALDRWVPERPARVQHRTGALWVLNGAAVRALRLDAGVDAVGVERDAAGRATGRLFRLDGWLGARVPRAPVSLRELSLQLARCGVVGVTDAGADNDASSLASIAAAQQAGELRQRVRLLGKASLPLPSEGTPGLVRGQRKLLLDERALPDLAEFESHLARDGRGVAIHCVTRVELMFALAACDAAGTQPGDRLEHASIAPPEAVERIRRLGLAVVTQPSFIAERGDQYAADVEPEDRPWLYRARAFLAAGIPLAAGSDAPFGEPDPWRAMRAAVSRRTEAGRVLGSAEALSPEEALALFTSPLDALGARPARLVRGARADLCLLRIPWSQARRVLGAGLVAATWRDGEPIFDAEREGRAHSAGAGR